MTQGNAPPKPPLGTIHVIFVGPRRTGSHATKVMSIAESQAKNFNFEPKRAKLEIRPLLSFSDEDKVGTIQSHDDALVVIEGYDVKWVMVD